jgi:hypothetical protein
MHRQTARLLLCGALIAATGAAAAEAGVATLRLGTGRVAGPGAKALPQAWVAPAGKAPRIDGRLDEAGWTAARPIVLGRLQRTGRVAPKTKVRLLHGGGVLYLGVRAAEPNVAGMKRAVKQPDGPAYQDDSVELFLMPFGGQGYCQIILSTAGGVCDRRERGQPSAWNSGAVCATVVGKQSWTLEAAVPMAPMLGNRPMPSRWRVNIYRNRRAGSEGQSQAWSPTFSGDYDVPARFGRLLFTPTPPPAATRKPSGPKGIRLIELDDGGAVLQFDLGRLAGAKVHHARLRAERAPIDGRSPDARVSVEIYRLASPHKPGQPPRTEGEPLPLAAPWYRWFDVTDLVRGWAGGARPNHGLYVKGFPGWRMETTFLDVTYDGKIENPPPQVKGLRAYHRAGQTFLTWQEVEDPVGKDQVAWGELKAILKDLDKSRRLRYYVYRSDRPITADTLARARLIAEVPPLSAWNVNGRNLERPIDHVIATAPVIHRKGRYGGVFDHADVEGAFGLDCPIDRFVIRDGGEPLPRRTGLYVHTVRHGGRAYYAVLTSVDGVQNTAALSAANATAEPVREEAGEGKPVLQGELPPGPLWRYPQKRLHYVRWVAPPLCNLPGACYNWSVGVPNELPANAPLELNLHRDSRSYWRTQQRLERDSIVLCPHDFPLQTWWYGYHESHGTLRSFAQGTVQPYTQRRLLSFIEWACGKWPVDRSRILVSGTRFAGGFGALQLGLRHPEVFSLVVAGHPLPDPTFGVQNLNKVRWTRGKFDSLVALFGKVGDGSRGESGKPIWDELNLVRRVEALPATAELPMVAMTSANGWGPSHEFYKVMLRKRRPLVAAFMWGGTTMLPVSATGTFPNVIRQLVRRNHPVVAFKSSKVDALLDGGRQGQFHLNYRWRTDDLVDRADRCEVTVFHKKTYGRGDPPTADVTIRRLSRFKVQPGKTYKWTVVPVGSTTPSGSGLLTVGADGLLTVPAVPVSQSGSRINVTRP